MIITKRALPRRTFLRGVGVTFALPFLDAMVPALTTAVSAAGSSPCRMGFIYVPNGTIQNMWVPTTVGKGFDWSPILSPLAPVRNHVTVLSGLAHRQADNFGDGNGDHARGTAVWLTGVHAWDRGRGGAASVQLATSVDQIAAAEYRPGRASAITRAEPRKRNSNRMRFRGLLLFEHHFMEVPHYTPAHGTAPARGI